jgi:hypothetical protein
VICRGICAAASGNVTCFVVGIARPGGGNRTTRWWESHDQVVGIPRPSGGNPTTKWWESHYYAIECSHYKSHDNPTIIPTTLPTTLFCTLGHGVRCWHERWHFDRCQGIQKRHCMSSFELFSKIRSSLFPDTVIGSTDRILVK